MQFTEANLNRMLAFTHIAAGLASSLLAAKALHAQPEQVTLIMSGGVLGSMMPDMDHPRSAFGSRVLPLSLLLSAIFGHRGITHSLLAVIGISGLCWWALNAVNWHQGYAVPVVFGIAAGYLSHLAGDWLTNSGVQLLWPVKRRFVSPIKLCTGDLREYLLAFVLYGWSIMESVRILK